MLNDRKGLYIFQFNARWARIGRIEMLSGRHIMTLARGVYAAHVSEVSDLCLLIQ